jgi:hypothetical protein
VDVAALERWRRGDHVVAEIMERIGGAFVDVLKRDAGEGVPAHRTLGIRRSYAAALLAIAYERVHRAVMGHDAARLPTEIEHAVIVASTILGVVRYIELPPLRMIGRRTAAMESAVSRPRQAGAADEASGLESRKKALRKQPLCCARNWR